MSTSILPYVLAAARRGWHVFPLAHGTKRPDSRFRAWERHATTDPEVIRGFWGRGRFNYGIACGPSRLVVVDLDVPKSGEEPPPQWRRPGITDGADVFATLAEQHQAEFPPQTVTVRTRRGGWHFYFSTPEGARLRNTTARLGWLVDTRASGGYVVGPGCYVADETGAGGYAPVSAPGTPVAPLPAWLAGLLTTERTPPVRGGQARAFLAHNRDLAGYAVAALRGEVQRVLDAPVGARNHTLNAAAFALGQLVGSGVLPHPLAWEALTAAGTDAGLSETECAATIRSGMDAGRHQPRGGAA